MGDLHRSKHIQTWVAWWLSHAFISDPNGESNSIGNIFGGPHHPDLWAGNFITALWIDRWSTTRMPGSENVWIWKSSGNHKDSLLQLLQYFTLIHGDPSCD